MVALGFALAALIGLSLGTMGGGGSILTVPIFVYVLGFAPKQAIAMSFPVVGGTSLVGAAGHWRGGNVDLRTALLFGIVAMAGAYAGGFVAAYLTGATQLVLLALAMLAAAWSMARPRRDDAAARTGAQHPALLALVGVTVGLLTGIIGIGGGFLYVPALVILARVPIKRAVGTSLIVIAMSCAAGLVSHLRHETVPWGFVLVFTLVAVLGILIGARLVRHVSPAQLRKTFAAFLIVMAALILFQNRGRFTATQAAAPGSAATERTR
jgi:uncharacterized membrane protein YfcA